MAGFCTPPHPRPAWPQNVPRQVKDTKRPASLKLAGRFVYNTGPVACARPAWSGRQPQGLGDHRRVRPRLLRRFRQSGVTVQAIRRHGPPTDRSTSVSGPLSKSDQSFLRQFSLAIGGLVLLTVVLVLSALAINNSEPKETNPNQPAKVAERIAPAGAVYAGDTGRAAMQAAADAAAKAAASQVAYGGTTDGKAIYDHLCTSCHTAGIAGAPKLGDKAMWGPRIKQGLDTLDRKSTRLNSSHHSISYAVFCLKKKKKK